MSRRSLAVGPLFVAAAAALWGADALLRKPLADSTTAATIVFGEHLVLVAITLPLLVGALAAVWRAGPRYILAAVVIGAGASAVATIALSLYYYGLQRTPAVTVSLAELAFPVSATVVGYFAFDARLTTSQWVGLLVTSAVVLLLPVRSDELVDVEPNAGRIATAHA